jgi:hypothetical protein
MLEVVNRRHGRRGGAGWSRELDSPTKCFDRKRIASIASYQQAIFSKMLKHCQRVAPTSSNQNAPAPHLSSSPPTSRKLSHSPAKQLPPDVSHYSQTTLGRFAVLQTPYRSSFNPKEALRLGSYLQEFNVQAIKQPPLDLTAHPLPSPSTTTPLELDIVQKSWRTSCDSHSIFTPAWTILFISWSKNSRPPISDQRTSTWRITSGSLRSRRRSFRSAKVRGRAAAERRRARSSRRFNSFLNLVES